MREDLDRILQDATLITIAFAIAIGWSLYQVAHGVAFFIDGLTVHLPSSSLNGPIPYSTQSGGLTWVIGHRIVTLDGIVIGLIELGAVLLAAVAVRRRVRPN